MLYVTLVQYFFRLDSQFLTCIGLYVHVLHVMFVICWFYLLFSHMHLVIFHSFRPVISFVRARIARLFFVIYTVLLLLSHGYYMSHQFIIIYTIF